MARSASGTMPESSAFSSLWIPQGQGQGHGFHLYLPFPDTLAVHTGLASVMSAEFMPPPTCQSPALSSLYRDICSSDCSPPWLLKLGGRGEACLITAAETALVVHVTWSLARHSSGPFPSSDFLSGPRCGW